MDPMIEEEEDEEIVTPIAVRCEVIAFLIARYGPPTTGELMRLFGCQDDSWIKEALGELRRQGRARPARLGSTVRWQLLDGKLNNMFA
jgi:hypothetical protein